LHVPVASNEKHESGYMSAARSIKRHYTGTRLSTSGSIFIVDVRSLWRRETRD